MYPTFINIQRVKYYELSASKPPRAKLQSKGVYICYKDPAEIHLYSKWQMYG